MRQLPPLHALRAFEAAARHLHFGRAAEELHLDSTAISHQVRKLEELLGTALFHRRPRPLRLTDIGAQLYPVICDAMDRMAEAIASVRQEPPRPLVVSMTMALAAEWFTPRLACLKEATRLDIAVHADNRPADLSGGGVDLAIRSQAGPDADGVWHHLFDDRLIAVGAPALLERSGHPDGPADLLAMPLVHYHWTSRQRDALGWEDWFARAGIIRRSLMIAGSFSEESHAVQAALSGFGVALLSERLIGDRLNSGDLIRIGEHHLPMPSFWAVYAEKHPRRADLDALVNELTVMSGRGLPRIARTGA